MRMAPAGWATDLAILELTGSTVQERGDHLVVRTPHNPDFHWGNFLFVMDEESLGDPWRWVTTFRLAFPEAHWVAIGLARMPEDREAWAAQGLDLELDDVLTTRTLPRRVPLAQGYTVRRLRGGDWAQAVARAVAENDRTGEEDPASFERFAQARAQTRRGLSERDLGAWFGAFAGGALVADLGIVRCGDTARYQGVSTRAEHRRRGLASHLLGVAAQWAADGGCDRWVIVTEDTNPAGRVYRSLGFAPCTGSVSAYRRPQPPPARSPERRRVDASREDDRTVTVAREWDHLASDAAYLASDAFVRSNAMLRALITDGPVRRRSHAELLAADDTLIAHEMGYGSLSAVNAAFRELAHTTPSGYRVMYTG